MHPSRRLPLFIALLTILSGCSGTSDKSASSPLCKLCPSLSHQVPSLPVAIYVLTRSDGTGNPLWTRGYVEELLDTASAQVGHAVTFTLRTYEQVAESHMYGLTQSDLLSYPLTLSRPGVLTVVISRPDTEDTAGQTMQAVRPGRKVPFLVMRSRHADWQGIGATARIFWHEVAHNAGLSHQPDAFLDDGGLHTDNVIDRDDGIDFLVTYAQYVMKGN